MAGLMLNKYAYFHTKIRLGMLIILQTLCL